MGFNQNKYDRIMAKLTKDTPLIDLLLIYKVVVGGKTKNNVYNLKGTFSISKTTVNSDPTTGLIRYISDYRVVLDTKQLEDLEIEFPNGSKYKLLFYLEDVNFYTTNSSWELTVNIPSKRQDMKMNYSFYSDGAYKGELALVSINNVF